MTDVAARLESTLADRYRIERELGAGGMATVYLAEDVRHHRKVAIKVLHPELSAVLGPERFLKEIELTANLQHPHILPLFDSGNADGLLFYVMPYVEGETLRGRLEREQQLPIADALRIASEVADALEYAHKRGVVHRDVKPENILLHDGRPLVADFGIALAVQQAGGARMTQTGMSLGTPQYMAPEQAMGDKSVDHRADIYALGAIAYEMLTGEPPFTGPNSQAIVAKVLTTDPTSLQVKRRSIPPHVEDAVLTALEKMPADRFASAREFTHALGGEKTAALPRAPSAGRSRHSALKLVPRGWLLAAFALNALLLVAAIVPWIRRPPQPAPSRQHVLLWKHRIPDPLAPGARILATQAAIAPDGSSIVFADSTADGYQLMRKVRDAAEAIPVAGTEGAVSPFFSPDGRWIGYVTIDGRLRKVPVGGGGSVTLSLNAGLENKAGAWLDDGTIVYTATRGDVARIPADGGATVPIPLPVQLGAVSSLWPIPGSRGFLFTACSGNCSLASNVYAYDFAADSARLLVPGAAGVWYAATGHLLYTSRDGGLYAMAFDGRRLVPRSGAVPLLEDVEPGSFTVSASGAALYSIDPSARTPAELTWVSRDGRTSVLDTAWRGRFEYPALSPDGTTLAVSLRDKTTDLWLRRSDGTRQKVIAQGAANWRASWMPDGRSLAFTSIRNPEDPYDVAVYHVRADGSARAQLFFEHRFGVWEVEISRDGRWLVVRLDEENFDSNVRARRLDGDTTLLPLLVDSSQSISVALSPDGRWLAYASNETDGQYEVFIASFPDMSSKRLVSSGGGTEPRWSRDGRELFFESRGQLTAVQVPPGPSLNPGNPRALFSLAGYRRARNRQQYDVGPDGRFVMIREAGRGTAQTAVYVEHWFVELLGRADK